jgi:nitrite reductase/ring-hydroxylating ferredoxin subunit
VTQVPSGGQSAAAPAICRLDELETGVAAAFDVPIDGEVQSLIVMRLEGGVHAYLNVCPHAGRRLDWAPGRFLLKDGVLVCAAHGASFAATSGACTAGPCRGEHLQRVDVEVVQGEVRLLSGTAG